MTSDRTPYNQDTDTARIDRCVSALVRLLAEQSVRESHITPSASQETPNAGSQQDDHQEIP